MEDILKKINLVLVFVSMIILTIQANEFRYSETTFGQLLINVQPNYQIDKHIKLEGMIIDYDIAKDTGDLIVIEKKSNEDFSIYFFDNRGNKKWEKSKQKPINCEISDFGNIIVISSRTSNEIYDQYGEMISSKEMFENYLLPSPDGRFFYTKTGMMSGEQKEMIIYDQELNRHKIHSPELDDMRRIRYRFVTNDRMLAYIDGTLKILSFKDYEINFLGAEYVDRGKHLGEFEGTFHDNKTDYSKYFVGVVAGDVGLYVFNMIGNLVFRDETPYDEFRFIDDYSLIASQQGVRNYMKVIDLKNNQERTFNFAFYSNSFGISNFDSITKINNHLFCNVNQGPSPYCLVIDLKDSSEPVYSLPNYSFYKINNKIYVIVESSNPEIFILTEKGN